MANIPIAQVPNAPQTGNSAVPLPVGAIRTPDIEYMGVVEDASYMAIGRAYENLGAAGQQASRVLGDFGLSMARASDEANLAKADSVKTDLLSKYYAEVERMPEDQWQSHWQSKYQDRLASEVGGMKMSTRDGSNRRDIWLQSTQTAVNAEIYTKSNKALVERGKQEVTNYINRARNEGRDEDAMAGYRRGATAGFWTPEDAEAGIIQIEEERKVSTLTSVIQQNPAQWRGELAKYQKEGKNPHNLRPEQVIQFRRMAEGTHSQLVQDASNEMLEQLETQSAAITNDDIEAAFTRDDIDAPRELINSLKKYRDLAYTDTPEGKADKNQKYSDLWQAIFNYDAESDVSMANPDTHKRAYQALQQEIIATAPEGERKPFLDTLNDMMGKAEQGKKSNADEIARGLVDVTGKLAGWGQLGDDGGWKEVKRDGKAVSIPKDPQRQLEVQTKRLEITNDIRRLMRENPDLTEEQAMERFKGILENRLDGGALFMQQPDEESWWDTLIEVATFGGLASADDSSGMATMARNVVMGPDRGPNTVTGGLGFRGFGGSPTDGLPDADEPLPPVQNMPPQGGAAPVSLPPDKQPYADQIANMAAEEGLGDFTPHLMLLVAQESNFNPNQTISTSSARGLFQLLNADRKKFGADSSVDGQIRAGLAKTKENIAAARRALGRDPDPFELYVVHYQGIGAGPAILRNPDGNFRQTLDATGGRGHAAKVMKANPWLVRDGVQTNQDFIDWVRQRLSKKAAQLGMA
jgi:hypothetical protein